MQGGLYSQQKSFWRNPHRHTEDSCESRAGSKILSGNVVVQVTRQMYMQAGTFEWKQGIFILQFLRSWAIEGIKQHLHGHRTVILQEVGSSRIWSLFHSQQCKPFPVKKIVLRSTANCASTSRFRFDCSVRGAGAYQGRLRKAWGPWQNAPFCYPPSPSMEWQTWLRSQCGWAKLIQIQETSFWYGSTVCPTTTNSIWSCWWFHKFYFSTSDLLWS